MALVGTDRGSGASNAASATTFGFSPGSNYTAGTLAVVCIAADNSVSGGATNNTSSVTDSLGNVWRMVQLPIFDNGAASAGVQGVIAVTDMSAGTLTTGSTITVTWLDAVTAKSWVLHEVAPTAGFRPLQLTGGDAAGQSGTTTPTLTSGTIAVGNLLIAAIFMECGTTQTSTQDGDATNGAWSAQQYNEVGSTTGGSAIVSQRKVQTTTASAQTFNPTMGASADTVGAWIEVTEVAVKRLASLGVG